MDTLWVACKPADRTRERAGYFAALERRGIQLRFLGDPNETARLHALLGAGRSQYLLHPDLEGSPIPDLLPHPKVISLCFQIDCFAKPKWKAFWATLFDYAIPFHPGFHQHYGAYAHEGVCMLPHAVDRPQYDLPEVERVYDIGWVGSVTGKNYRTRTWLMPLLAARYRMNDFGRYHAEHEVPGIYRRSRVVVNIPRDDHPSDANTRCFEAMAAGALLITKMPTELSDLGLVEGRHFVGYRSERELFALLATYASDEERRAEIAGRGRTKVLSEHSFDVRVAQLLDFVTARGGAQLAPARRWSAGRRAAVYCHYHAKQNRLGDAVRRLAPVALGHPLGLLPAGLVVGRCAWHRTKARLVDA